MRGSHKSDGCRSRRRDCNKKERDCPHQRGECDEKQVLTFWLDEYGRPKDAELRTGFFVFLMNLFNVTFLWLILAFISSVFWAILFVEYGVTFNVDGTGVGIFFGLFSYYVGQIVSITDGKRTGGASNWIGLGSATKNLMSIIHGTINLKTLVKNPMVEMDSHDGSKYVVVRVPAQMLFRRMAVTANGIYAAQRNSNRRGVQIELLPIYADQKAFMKALGPVDPIEALQGMLRHYVQLLYDTGCIGGEEEWSIEFYKDLINALGNIDIGGKIPIAENITQYTNVVLFIGTIILPLWFSRIYVGYGGVWVAPLLLWFFYAIVGFSNRQYKIAVDQADNTYSGIAVVKELYEVSASNLARAVAINRQIESRREALVAMGETGEMAETPPPYVKNVTLVDNEDPEVDDFPEMREMDDVPDLFSRKIK